MAATGTGFWQQVWRRPWRRHLPSARFESAAPTADAGAPPAVRVGGYLLVRQVAHGTMGEMHLATDPVTGAPVALKTVRFGGRALGRERFLRESAAATRLIHPHIVCTFATGVDGSGDNAVGWIAMEWVAGHDLSRYVPRHRLLPEAVVLEVAARVADALAYAHAQGVIHRDLKPANVLVNLAQGVVKVGDFGCARLSDSERSRSGLLVGTPVFMAPEQILGGTLDGRCDLYALGVMVFQMLTGRLPFESPSMGGLLEQIATQPAPALSQWRPDLPPLLSDILARVLDKQAARRQPDGEQLAREFRLIALSVAESSAALLHASEAQ